MGLFFNYDNPVCNEGGTPVIFSYDPSIGSLKELLIYELSQMAYYEEKIREFGNNTEKIADSIINYITLAVVNLDFRKDRFLTMIKNLYDEVQKLMSEYKEICKKENITFEPIIGEKLSFEKKNEKINAVNFGEKQSVLKNTIYSPVKKMLGDIAVMLISNACLCITELEDYGINTGKNKFAIPKLLKMINHDNLTDKKLKNEVYNFAKINYEIMLQLQENIMRKYGPIQETEVNLNIKKGKCILVSGHYYKNLEMLLESIKDEDINIYTHNEMLYAHAFEHFKKYKNLTGHYQHSLKNVQLDFASFPGAVLLTKNSYSNFDVIRGRIFTPDINPAYGINKINENDFSPLIEAAKSEKGFLNNISIKKIHIGYNIEEIKRKLKNIIEKIENNQFKNLVLIGAISYNFTRNEYFEKLLKNLPEDCFVISFSYCKKIPNLWHIDSLYDSSLMYIIIEELKKYKSILKNKTTVFIPQCQIQTISHAFNFKIAGIKNIFLGECCPNIINPSLINGMTKIFGIKKISESAKEDLKIINKE